MTNAPRTPFIQRVPSIFWAVQHGIAHWSYELRRRPLGGWMYVRACALVDGCMCVHLRVVSGGRACRVVGRRYIAISASGRERFVCLRKRRTAVVRFRCMCRSAYIADLHDKLCVPAHHVVGGRARSRSRVEGVRAMHACAVEGRGNRHTARRRGLLYGT